MVTDQIFSLLNVDVQVNSDGIGCGNGFKFVIKPQSGDLTSPWLLHSLDCLGSRYPETAPLRGREDDPRLRDEGRQVRRLLLLH